MTDSMGPGKLVRHMQNPSYTYDEYLIRISSVICENPSYSGPSYPSSPVYTERERDLCILTLIATFILLIFLSYFHHVNQSFHNLSCKLCWGHPWLPTWYGYYVLLTHMQYVYTVIPPYYTVIISMFSRLKVLNEGNKGRGKF